MITSTELTSLRTPLPPGNPRSTLRWHYLNHVVGAVFPVTAAAIFYGWRGVLVLAHVVLIAVVAALVWQRIGRRGAWLRLSQVAYMAGLLGLMLPPHLLSTGDLAPYPNTWAIVFVAPILLVALIWLLGGVGYWLVHPAVLVYLAIAMLYGEAIHSHVVLHRPHILVGDIEHQCPPAPRQEPWIYARSDEHAQAGYYERSAAVRLSQYTHGRDIPRGVWLSVDALIRDSMPPLEDLVIGGHPGPLGASSAIAVLIGGLFLLYRGLIDYRIPLLAVLSAYLAMLLLPVPVAATDAGVLWRPVFLPRAQVDWATMLTFTNYQILASPLLFMAFFLATSSSIAPMHNRAKGVYGVLLGILAAACQLYVSSELGPYLALLVASLFSPWLDHRLKGRPLL